MSKFRKMFHIPEGFTEDDHMRAWQHRAQQQIKEQESFRLYRKKVTELKERYRQELYDYIGEEYLHRYLKLHNRRIKNMQLYRQRVPKTLEGMQLLKEKRIHNINESVKLVKRTGLDESKLFSIRHQHHEQRKNCFDSYFKIEEEAEPKVDLAVTRSSDWLSLKPYIWEDIGYNYNSTKGPDSYSYDFDVDTVSGEMMHTSTINLRDTGDDDDAYVTTYVEIGSVVRVPEDCDRIHVMGVFRNIASTVSGDLSNECGYSSYLLANTIHAVVTVERYVPAGDAAWKTIWLYDTDENNGTFFSREGLSDWGTGYVYAPWEIDLWEPGETVSTRLLSFPGPFSRGQWLAVWIGTRAYNDVSANDFTVTSHLSYHLDLTDILVNFPD